MRRFGTFFEIAERRQSCYHGTRMVIICSGLNFMSGRSLADWFRENRTDISIDTFLIVFAIYFAASPARSTYAILLQAGVVTGEHGDQIFGSNKLAENPEWIGSPISRYLGDSAFTGYLEQIELLNTASPVPIRIIETMLWWWNFTVKW